MAAAYAALISLSQIINQLLHPPPSHHFLIPTQQIERLQLLVADLIDFLEKFSNSNHETEHLETRIAGAAYEAEDVIESYVVKQIQANFEADERSAGSFPSMLKLIEDFVSIKEEAEKISKQKGVEDAGPSAAACSSSSVVGGSNNNKNMMIGFDEHLSQIRTLLAVDKSDLQITHVVGMGGVGKTTLATHVYKDAWVVDRFMFRAWVSVSPEYNLGDIILALLQQINCNIKAKELDFDRLGEVLYKELFGRRYFVVLDDMWDIQVWDMLRRFLPNNSEGSRILVTTRILDLAKDMKSSESYKLGLLNDENSLDLMLGVLGKECFPNQLEDIGKSIARKCKGLPLALVVIGRLLANSPKTKAFWEYVEQNVASAANDENDEQCMSILRLSYSQLPVYLKPCFLYLAVFPKNVEIHASRLIRLWVAEGFIKPAPGRTLEEVAEGYLEDLLNRSLVMVKTRGLIGKVKTCSIHDLIRDLCTKEVGTEKFHLCIPKFDGPSGSISSLIESERRLSIHTSTSIANKEEYNDLESPTLNRSFFSYSRWVSRRRFARRLDLVRILDVVDFYSMEEILRQFNLRYITCSIHWKQQAVSSRISLLWNLQTLVAPPALVSLPSEIWRMPQLRHLKMSGITLPHPPDKGESGSIIVLQHLQTLSTVKDFIFREHVLKRIPNLKKLGIHYDASEKIEYSCLSDLASLKKLESLFLSFRGTWENFVLPSSLKKLRLSNCRIPWEYMSVVGILPNLEVLKLQTHAAEGQVWNLKADEFCRLKFLLIDGCEMKTWAADDGYFPRLEHLHLENMEMEDIPVEFAEIPTLQTINLNYCSRSLFASAKAISMERESFDYDEVQIQSFPSEVPELKKENVVGVEDEVQRFKGYLSEETEELDIIAIFDMPGIGKTTLAEKIFHDPEIVHQFPKRVWVHVSQDFTSKDILLAILKAFTCIDEEIITKENYQLMNMVLRILSNEKFLVVMDDVRSREDWDELQFAFPTWKNRGKVLITSRDKEIGWYINHHKDPHMRHFLDVEERFSRLQSVVFGKNQTECPPELEAECGLIAELCVGLPNFKLELLGGILLEYSKAPSSVRKKAWEEVEKSFLRFQSVVFGNNQPECPPELDAGCRLIAELGAGMLPSDVGGILLEFSNASFRMKAWKEVYGILTTFLRSGFDSDSDSDFVSIQQVISLSYKRLPYHLRKCFLYMGIFPGYYDIPAWRLIRLWIAEGIIQQNDEMMSLEEIAEYNLEDLISRNLVRVRKLNGIGKVKSCYIYDEIRDFCRTEAGNVGEEIKVFSYMESSLPKDQFLKYHRLSIDSNALGLFVLKFLSGNLCGPSVHTITCFSRYEEIRLGDELSVIPTGFKELRVLDMMPFMFIEIPSDMYRLLHIRYMVLSAHIKVLPSDFSKLENIQTVVIKTDSETLDIKADILNMIHLRHFKTNASATLPEAKTSRSSSAGVGDGKIQTLGNISPESCTTDVLYGRAHNVKALSVRGKLARWIMDEMRGSSFDSLRTLGNLENLKLKNDFVFPFVECRLHSLPPVDRFPPKLKILSLYSTYLPWSQMSIIGSLDKLEVLKLKAYAFDGEIWEANVGDFRHLQVLHIGETNLKTWKISQQQFPRLKRLQLSNCQHLLEVPIELVDVPSFQELNLEYCSWAAYASAWKIRKKVKENNNMMPGNVVRTSIQGKYL